MKKFEEEFEKYKMKMHEAYTLNCLKSTPRFERECREVAQDLKDNLDVLITALKEILEAHGIQWKEESVKEILCKYNLESIEESE